LDRYADWSGLRSPAQCWLAGYDEEDERFAYERSRPSFSGQVEWQPMRRMRDEPPGTQPAW
jgi:hypothetical protein